MINPSDRPVVLVTGAARRIGAAIARALHAAGFDLALHCRSSRAELDALRGELEASRPGSTLDLQADLAHAEAAPVLVADTLRRFGRLDGLVNNASAFHPTPLGEITPQDWDALFAVNARAPLLLAQAAADALRGTRGAIVNLVDIYAERPLPGYSVYAMSKAALTAATLALAGELAPEVRVNGIAPGAVLWPESGKDETARADILARTPLARTGEPADIAGTVLWLLRDARFVTGQVIRVDGGRTLPI
ncbi:MAG: pteridine reductase [Xanthomonadales bacterium]|nr:pteridine reductase [Xanthomonadales bacterium]